MSTEQEFNARLDRLTDRHEALTQSLELLVYQVAETSASVKTLTGLVALDERRGDIQGE